MVAVVVVDQEARDQGYAIQIDGWLVEDPLPVAVSVGEVLKIVDPDGRTEPMQVEPGEAWEVSGPDGEAWMAMLDDEIRSDLLVVKGPPAAIDALATSLGAEVFEADGKIWLSGEGILLQSGWVDDEKALQVDEVSFVKVRRSNPPPQAPLASRGPVESAVSDAVRTVDPPPTAPASLAPERPTRAQRRARGTQPELEAFPSDGELRDFQRFAGIHICNNELLSLRSDGTYQFRGSMGTWTLIGSRVARLLGDDGTVLWRAGFNEGQHCVAVWAAPLP